PPLLPTEPRAPRPPIDAEPEDAEPEDAEPEEADVPAGRPRDFGPGLTPIGLAVPRATPDGARVELGARTANALPDAAAPPSDFSSRANSRSLVTSSACRNRHAPSLKPCKLRWPMRTRFSEMT